MSLVTRYNRDANKKECDDAQLAPAGGMPGDEISRMM